MARVLTNEKNYYDIADTIRQMKEVNTTYKPREMSSALKDIYSNEVEGVPPLTFESNGMPLIDYRIDGASGGVGERTKNLFDENAITNEILKDNDGTTNSNNNWRCSNFINIPQNNNNILISWESDSAYFQVKIAFYDNQKNFISLSNYGINNTYLITFNLPNNCEFIRFSYSQTVNNAPANRHNIQIILGSTPADYEPYGYKVPVVVSGKNLLQNTATSQTIKGVAFTVNSDSSVTCNGTATATTFFTIMMTINQGTYIVSGAPVGCNSETPYVTIRLRTPFGGGDVPPFDNNDFGTGVTLISKKNNNNDYFYKIRVPAGYTCDNLTFYPMIRKADIEDDTYEPYHEPTTTNIYLDEPIEENESISLSDTEVNIPTIEGTNTLTIDTTVQPSNVYVQAPKDNEEIVYLTTVLEEGI